nr:hypothetical protein [uncultured Sellimonas sp.]
MSRRKKNRQNKKKEKSKVLVIKAPDMETVSRKSRHIWDVVKEWIYKVKQGVYKAIHKIEEKSLTQKYKFKENSDNAKINSREKEETESPSEFRIGTAIRNMFIFIWNVWWIFLTVVLASLTAFGLFGLGVFVVLAFQGYPIIGCMISALGISVTGAGLLLLTWSFRKKYRKMHTTTSKETEPEFIEEV